MTGKPIVILGCSGHARVVADACRSAGRQVAGYLDRAQPTGTLVDGLPVLGDDERLEDSGFVEGHEFIVGIGDQQLRRKLSLEVRERGGRLVSVAHDKAVVAPDVRIGEGTVLLAGSVINPGSILGDFVIVNTGATVDHDNVLGDGVHVCPGVHLAGGVRCGRDVFIGTGAAVIPGVTIGSGAIVGAGAVVLQDVPAGVTFAGNPAVPIR
jgi:sugar O-acyltransferase (sialic acid O-acetyltransferase NeuD family)